MNDREYVIRLSLAEQIRVDAEAARTGRSTAEIVAATTSRAVMRLAPPPQPAPRHRRPLAEVRAQRRHELGGPSPYTTEIQTLTTKEPTP